EKAIGLDLGSEPVRADALARAAASGEVACSWHIRLLTGGRDAVLMFLADTSAGAVNGLLDLAVEVDELLRPLQGGRSAGVRWLVRELDAPGQPCMRGDPRDLPPAEKALWARSWRAPSAARSSWWSPAATGWWRRWSASAPPSSPRRATRRCGRIRRSP